MIAHLRGRLLSKHPNQAIVDVGGVGYDLTISVPTFSELPGVGSEVAFHVHTHVREDLIGLYGFLRPEEKRLFEKLITILSGMPAEEMVAAIRGNDVARLTRIPGIGRKTGERMVLELRDKLPPPVSGEAAPVARMSAIEEDVLSALMNLGYQKPAAERALAGVKSNGTFEVMFRGALSQLSK